ncbi:MAG: hypothetical protein WAN60_00250 [Candidatus Sulfotelmatobacter sp.]
MPTWKQMGLGDDPQGMTLSNAAEPAFKFGRNPPQRLNSELNKEMPMSFGIYAIGFVIMLVGVIYGAYLMHMPTHWIAVGAIILLGVGILSGVKATRQRDSSE